MFHRQDLTTAPGPATSTSAGQQEAGAACTNDAVELVRWLSVVDEDDADTAEITTLPSLQRLLERLETQAGRVVANEAYSMVEKGGFVALDEVGRARVLSLARDLHALCTKSCPEEEAKQLLWRV